jgi:hypothetical protein
MQCQWVLPSATSFSNLTKGPFCQLQPSKPLVLPALHQKQQQHQARLPYLVLL